MSLKLFGRKTHTKRLEANFLLLDIRGWEGYLTTVHPQKKILFFLFWKYKNKWWENNFLPQQILPSIFTPERSIEACYIDRKLLRRKSIKSKSVLSKAVLTPISFFIRKIWFGLDAQAWLFLGIIVNFGALFYYKYFSWVLSDVFTFGVDNQKGGVDYSPKKVKAVSRINQSILTEDAAAPQRLLPSGHDYRYGSGLPGWSSISSGYSILKLRLRLTQSSNPRSKPRRQLSFSWSLTPGIMVKNRAPFFLV